MVRGQTGGLPIRTEPYNSEHATQAEQARQTALATQIKRVDAFFAREAAWCLIGYLWFWFVSTSKLHRGLAADVLLPILGTLSLRTVLSLLAAGNCRIKAFRALFIDFGAVVLGVSVLSNILLESVTFYVVGPKFHLTPRFMLLNMAISLPVAAVLCTIAARRKRAKRASVPNPAVIGVRI